MSVGFERLGPGQVGRWAYQVIGSDGPINNPSRIRYLAAPAAQAVTASPLPAATAAATAYMQMATLGLSAANLGVSLWTARETVRQTRMLRNLQSGVDEIATTVSQTLEMTMDLQIEVGEGNLLLGLKYALTQASSEDGVNLLVLDDLVGRALAKFSKPLGSTNPGSAPGLVLSSEVHDLLETCLSLFWSARATALAAAPALDSPIAGSVDRHSPPVIAELLADRAATLHLVNTGAESTGESIRRHLHDTFKFYGDTKWYYREAKKRVTKDIAEPIRDTMPFGQEAAELLAAVDPAHLEGITKSATPAEVADAYRSYLTWWFAASDAGLLWLARNEIRIRHQDDYWHRLAGWANHDPSAVEGTVTTPLPSDCIPAVAR